MIHPPPDPPARRRGARAEIRIALPAWVDTFVDADRRYDDDDARIGLAIDLARQNVLHATGGPFGAAVFEESSGRLESVGVNCVLRLGNSVLHAEIVALMLAERAAGSHTLRDVEGRYALFTSCEPCAMCLGAVHWSGVSRLVFAARREDAERLRFDEGPVFRQSYEYLASRGLAIVEGVRREEALAVFDLYVARGGPIYNG